MTLVTVVIASAFLAGYLLLGTPTIHTVAWSAVGILMAVEVVREMGGSQGARAS